MAQIKTTSKAGIQLIESFEGYSPKMYKDTAGLPTIGYGTLIDTEAEKYLLNATITKAQAEVLLRKDLLPIEQKLKLMIKVTLLQNQFDALVSFCYNLGTNALRTSSLLKKINLNPSDATITTEFMKWVYAGGKVSVGLKKRRAGEAGLFFFNTPTQTDTHTN